MALTPSMTDIAVLDALSTLRTGVYSKVATSAAAREYTGDTDWRMVVMVCADAAAHVFLWNAASVAADDGTTVIKPTAIAVGDPGRWLQDDASQVIGSAVGGPPTGAAGGDLGGTYPNPSVATVGGSAAATVAGQRAAHELAYDHSYLPDAVDADTVDGQHAAAFEAAGATAAHSGLATGAHGVGASTVASVADVAAKSDLGHLHTGADGTGKLAQANTHQSPDTDAAVGSLHHTIGVGATQAAAGNHTHDGTYAPYFHPLVFTGLDYGVIPSDEIVQATASGITLTLPTAVGATGKLYRLDNASTGNITVATTGGETINGLTTQTVPSDSCMVVYSDGTGWRIT